MWSSTFEQDRSLRFGAWCIYIWLGAVPAAFSTEATAAPTLTISAPMATPAGIALYRPASVILRAFVFGSAKPPALLVVDRLDQAGKELEKNVAILTDAGGKADDRANDLIYTGKISFEHSDLIKAPRTLYYRVRTEGYEPAAQSPIGVIAVTEFHVGMPHPSPAMLVKGEPAAFRIFADEIGVKIRPGVSESRVSEIAKSAAADVVGFSPPLRLYLFRIRQDGFAEETMLARLRTAIKIVSAYDDVEFAVPNRETRPLSVPHDPAVPPCGDSSKCQWYLDQGNGVDAIHAWPVSGGGANMTVGILEAWGEVKYAHTDLIGRGHQSIGCATGWCNKQHATQVAGVIGANGTDSLGIAGLAYEAELLAYVAYGEVQLAGAIPVVVADKAKIINISQTCGTGGSPLLKDALLNANGALIVLGAGNPAKLSWPTCAQANDKNLFPAVLADDADLAPAAVAAGAVDSAGALAEWKDWLGRTMCSNSGSWVHLYVPGTGIYSTAAYFADYVHDDGTSFSAAIVSGAAAMLWSMRPGLTAVEVNKWLMDAPPCASGVGKCLDLFKAVSAPP